MPRVRSIAASAKPASDQKNKNVPATMSAVARQNPSSNCMRPLSTSVTYDHAISGDGREEADEADPGVAHAEARVLRAGRQEVDELVAPDGQRVEQPRHGEDEHEAPQRQQEGVGREHESVLFHLDVEQPRRDERQPLRQREAQGQAHAQRNEAHRHRLQKHDDRHAGRVHAQHEVGAELLLASADEEPVRVQHEKAQHAGDDHAEHPQHLTGHLEHAGRGGILEVEQDGLAGHRVERVEHRHAEHERDEVDSVVAYRAPNVAESEFSQHRARHRPGTSPLP